jgi:hypothetical protein
MAQQPYAEDWTPVGPGLVHSPKQDLWYDHNKQRVYDRRSAMHNGIIGIGAQLKEVISEVNSV